MDFFKVGKEEYEIYLSSNGVCNIEERTGKSLTELQQNAGFNTIRLLLWACLWEKNRLSVEDVGNLIDEWMESHDNSMTILGDKIGKEMKQWAKKLNKDDTNNEKKKVIPN